MKFFDDMRFQKEYLEKHRSYLKKGKYVLCGNLRAYTLKELQKGNWFPSEKSSLENRVKVWIARAFYSVRVRQDGSEFCAQAVYFSNMPKVYNRDAKFFDYEHKKILTVCPHEKRYEMYMRHRSWFEPYFPMVDLLAADPERFVFEERIVDKKKVAKDEWESVFHTLFEIYSKYYPAPGILQKAEDYPCAHFSDLAFGRQTFSTVLYMQHGDLSSDNFIYDTSGSIYIIDYDNANYYPYFFDMFFLIMNLYIWEDNDAGVRLLLDGAFDRYFDFSLAGDVRSVYDAFLLFANFYLDFYTKKRLPDSWLNKYENCFRTVLTGLREKNGK